jgi:hypothetical protein
MWGVDAKRWRISGVAVVVEDKILYIGYRLVTLEDGGNGKSGFDADDGQVRGAREAVFFGVVGACGSGDDHQVRPVEKLLK